MALISCPECGAKISDRAGTCPQCGFPIQDYLDDQSKKEEKELNDALFAKKETFTLLGRTLTFDEDRKRCISVGQGFRELHLHFREYIVSLSRNEMLPSEMDPEDFDNYLSSLIRYVDETCTDYAQKVFDTYIDEMIQQDQEVYPEDLDYRSNVISDSFSNVQQCYYDYRNAFDDAEYKIRQKYYEDYENAGTAWEPISSVYSTSAKGLIIGSYKAAFVNGLVGGITGGIARSRQHDAKKTYQKSYDSIKAAFDDVNVPVFFEMAKSTDMAVDIFRNYTYKTLLECGAIRKIYVYPKNISYNGTEYMNFLSDANNSNDQKKTYFLDLFENNPGDVKVCTLALYFSYILYDYTTLKELKNCLEYLEVFDEFIKRLKDRGRLSPEVIACIENPQDKSDEYWDSIRTKARRDNKKYEDLEERDSDYASYALKNVVIPDTEEAKLELAFRLAKEQLKYRIEVAEKNGQDHADFERQLNALNDDALNHIRDILNKNGFLIQDGDAASVVTDYSMDSVQKKVDEGRETTAASITAAFYLVVHYLGKMDPDSDNEDTSDDDAQKKKISSDEARRISDIITSIAIKLVDAQSFSLAPYDDFSEIFREIDGLVSDIRRNDWDREDFIEKMPEMSDLWELYQVIIDKINDIPMNDRQDFLSTARDIQMLYADLKDKELTDKDTYDSVVSTTDRYRYLSQNHSQIIKEEIDHMRDIQEKDGIVREIDRIASSDMNSGLESKPVSKMTVNGTADFNTLDSRFRKCSKPMQDEYEICFFCISEKTGIAITNRRLVIYEFGFISKTYTIDYDPDTKVFIRSDGVYANVNEGNIQPLYVMQTFEDSQATTLGRIVNAAYQLVTYMQDRLAESTSVEKEVSSDVTTENSVPGEGNLASADRVENEPEIKSQNKGMPKQVNFYINHYTPETIDSHKNIDSKPAPVQKKTTNNAPGYVNFYTNPYLSTDVNNNQTIAEKSEGSDKAVCTRCGKNIPRDARFCPYCGKRVPHMKK